MWIQILYTCAFSTVIILPFLYRSKHPSMLRFYCNMGVRKTFRKMYTQVLMLFLLTFHFYYLTLFQSHYDLIPSSALCFLMFSHNLCDRIFTFLKHDYVLAAVMVLALVCLFIPHFLPLGFSFGVLVFGAIFYPSRWFRNKMQSRGWQNEAGVGHIRLAEWYFDHGTNGLYLKMKKGECFRNEIKDAEYESIEND